MSDKTIDVSIAEMHKDIEYIKLAVDKFDKKFSAKWVEKVMVFTLTGVGIAIVGSGLNLILK